MTPYDQNLPFSVKSCRKCGNDYDATRRKCPVCLKAYMKTYNEKNKEHILDRQREYYKANKEAIRQYESERRKNPERIEAKRADYQRNRDRYRKKMRNYRARNSEKFIYRAMLDRCLNEKSTGYKNYGGRGITVCDRWRGLEGFINFQLDVGPRPSSKHSLERRDVNGNYDPGNCCWATPEEQGGNKRTSVRVTYKGKTKCLRAWSREFGVRYGTLHSRLQVQGWDANRVFSELERLSSFDVKAIMVSRKGQIAIKKLSDTRPKCLHPGWSARCVRCAEKAFVALVRGLDGCS